MPSGRLFIGGAIIDLLRNDNHPHPWEPTAQELMDRLARHDTIAAKATRRLLRAWVRARRHARSAEKRHEKAQDQIADLIDNYWAEKEAADEKLANWKAEVARLAKELAEERGRSATLACVLQVHGINVGEAKE